MVTHVIFDLDGTLLNTLGDLAASVNFSLSENGLPVRSIDEIRRFIGNGIRKLIARSVPECCPPELEGEVFSCSLPSFTTILKLRRRKSIDKSKEFENFQTMC